MTADFKIQWMNLKRLLTSPAYSEFFLNCNADIRMVSKSFGGFGVVCKLKRIIN